jgi:hypothetical protein
LASDLLNKLVNYVRVRKAELKAEAKRRAALSTAAKQSSGSGASVPWWLLAVCIGAAHAGRMFVFDSPSSNPPEPWKTSNKATPVTTPHGDPVLPTSMIDIELKSAKKRGILPRYDSSVFANKWSAPQRVNLDEEKRLQFEIPDDVDAFREHGELVLRRTSGNSSP